MLSSAIKTDILIIGAGPCGLFTVFEAGLLKLRCHLIDTLPIPGGQCAEIYPKKPIYDIPGFPSILAGQLTDNLMEQIAPFNPTFTLGEMAQNLEKLPNNSFQITTDKGTTIEAPVVAIAAGLGAFEPRKPPIPQLAQFENKGVEYIIKDPEIYRNKKLVIAGGGDSALDWTIHLAPIAQKITLVHRRQEFRGAPDSVEKIQQLAEKGTIELLTDAEAIALGGNGKLAEVQIQHKTRGIITQVADHFIPLFGLLPRLGPIANWGLEIEDKALKVNTFDYSTNIPGIYAIGDINTYPGKLKLILCGFHEATLMVQSAYQRIHQKKPSFKYTTVNGIETF